MTFQSMVGRTDWPMFKCIDEMTCGEDRQIKIICDVLPWLAKCARAYYVAWAKKELQMDIKPENATQGAIKKYILHDHEYDAIDISRLYNAFKFYYDHHKAGKYEASNNNAV